MKTKFLSPVLVVMMASSTLSFAQNYFSGPFAGASNTTGNYNSFAGYSAGRNNTTGNYNTAFGYYAGRASVASSSNTSIGAFAGYSNLSTLNIFIGYRSGYLSATGFSNIMIGPDAGYRNTSGSYNIFIGQESGRQNTTGQHNTFVGFRNGIQNTTGSNNTFVGNVAGADNTTGVNNSLFGAQAGQNNDVGLNNSFFGYRSGTLNSAGSRNAFFGVQSGETNSTGSDNTFIGREAGRNNTTGTSNTALGSYALQASAALTNTTAIGSRSIVRVSNTIVLGSVKGENGATTTIRVGIGTTSPSYLLHVNGTAAKPGGGAWTVASDRRLKTDVEPYYEGLNEIMQINPVWFRYNGKAGLPTDKRYVGVIAQDMQKIAPHSVGEFAYDNGEGQVEKYLDYDPNAMVYALINAVKELHATYGAEISKLKEEIAALKGQPLPENLALQSAKLWQNAPNPYGVSTKIRYYVPESTGSAQIRIIAATGQEVYSRELTVKGDGEIEVSNQLIANGSYIYQLVVDGVMVDHKKMIQAK